MSRICLSYRRSDSAAIVGRIYDRLVADYGAQSVFMDVSDIPYGADFRKHIQDTFRDTDVLIAAIGPAWLGQGASGTARIDEKLDPVRVEIQTALRLRILVIPVLVEGARMPSADELPRDIRDLAFRNAMHVDSGVDFHPQMGRLMASINRALGLAVSEGAASDALRDEKPGTGAAKSGLAARSNPVSTALSYFGQLLPYFLVPVVLLLLAHYLIVMKLDRDAIYLRPFAVVIPAVAGFVLLRNLRLGIIAAGVLGLSIALVAVGGMMTIVGLVDQHAILPRSETGWQEVAEYLVTITLATAAGNLFARAIHAAAPRRWRFF
jgi:TIR domain